MSSKYSGDRDGQRTNGSSLPFKLRFDKRLGVILVIFLLLGTLYVAVRGQNGKILVPRPFFVSIDDMGYSEGSSLGETGGAFRAGLRREFDVRDYRAVVELGKAVGVRLQGLFVVGEMDREGIVAEYPTASQDGSGYDNSKNVNDVQLEVAKYIEANAAYLEFGLHGTGHEHWENGVRTRAEWYDLENDKPWPEQDGRDHVELFKRIIAQYGWTPEEGHSFPESFVPAAYAYHWNPDGNFSTGKLMAENGVKYGNMNLQVIRGQQPPLELGGGFDHGLLVVDRKGYGNDWYMLATLPTEPLETFSTDIITGHWPNFLAQDDFLQADLTQEWVEFFKKIQGLSDRYVAKNTEQFSSQWIYRKYAKFTERERGRVLIDTLAIPDVVYERDMLGNLVLAVPLPEKQHVSTANLDGEPIAAYLEEAGFGYIYLPPLKKGQHEFTYSIGRQVLPLYVRHTGTSNVYRLHQAARELSIDLKMYGTQVVRVVGVEKPTKVSSSNEFLTVIAFEYDDEARSLDLHIHGRNMQGERGTVTISF